MSRTISWCALCTPRSNIACSPASRIAWSVSFLTFSTTSSMRAGWMRPSAMSRSSEIFAIWRRTGSKAERMTASGVSSMIRSTPLAPDDAPLHLLARQRHDRDRRLGDVVARVALDRGADDLLGLLVGDEARLLLGAADRARRLGLDLLLEALEELAARLLGRHPGDLLQARLGLLDEPADLLL